MSYTPFGKPQPTSGFAKGISGVVKFIFGAGGTQATPDPAPKNASPNANGQGDSFASGAKAWQVEADWRSIIRDVEAMESNDEFAKMSFIVIADHATTFDSDDEYSLTDPSKRKTSPVGFQIVAKNPKVQAALSALSERLALETEVWQIAYRLAKLGTYLPEVVIDPDTNLITALQETQPTAIWPKLERGRKIKGWLERLDRNVNSVGSTDPGRELEEWQICPFFFGPRRGFWALPPIATARYNWKRLQRLEDSIAIARLKAVDAKVHKVPVGKNSTVGEIKQALEDYKAVMTKTVAFPFGGSPTAHPSAIDENTEYFLPVFDADSGKASGDVDNLAASHGNLANLTDLQWHRERFLSLLGVPIVYLQVMSAQKTHVAAGAGMGGVDKQFAKTLRRMQRSIVGDAKNGGLRRLCDLQLLLLGIVPAPGMYDIVLPNIESRNEKDDAQTALYLGQAAAFYKQAFGALPLQLMAERFLPGLNEDQQEVIKAFLDGNAKTIQDSWVKAIKEAAKPKPTSGAFGATGTGSGNHNKGSAASATEQVGQAVAEAFSALQGQILAQGEELGIDLSEIDFPSADEIAQQIQSRVEFAEIGELLD